MDTLSYTIWPIRLSNSARGRSAAAVGPANRRTAGSASRRSRMGRALGVGAADAPVAAADGHYGTQPGPVRAAKNRRGSYPAQGRPPPAEGPAVSTPFYQHTF